MKDYIKSLTLSVHPWTRFFARMLDLCVFGIILEGILLFVHPPLISSSIAANFVFILFWWMLIEPIFLSTWGTTLGKFILGIEVRTRQEQKLKYYEALGRSFWVWLVGFGVGAPFVYFFTLFASYQRLKETGTTFWDKDNFVVVYQDVNKIRVIITAVIITASLLLSVGGVRYYHKSTLSMNDSVTIQDLNKGLPTMLDSETEALRVYFDKNTLNYEYRLVNQDVHNMNKDMFYDYMRAVIISQACEDKFIRPILARGSNISYNYIDKNDASVVNIVIKPSDCR